MRRPLLVFLVLVTALPSCNSFNHTLLITTPSASTGVPTAPPLETRVEPKTGADTLRCPFYTLPHLDGMPELPYHDLEVAQRQPDPDKAVEAVVKQHILDLRLYIRTMNKRLEESYNQYLIACHTVSPTPVLPGPSAASDAAASRALGLPPGS